MRRAGWERVGDVVMPVHEQAAAAAAAAAGCSALDHSDKGAAEVECVAAAAGAVHGKAAGRLAAAEGLLLCLEAGCTAVQVVEGVANLQDLG